MTQRIGLCGGSFDPIHVGHLIAARSVAERLGLSRVILVPAAQPPHKPERTLTAAAHRLAMTRLAVEGDPLFEVSDLELDRPGPSYTIDTVRLMQSRIGSGIEWFWIIGADSLPELTSWHRVGELVRLVQIVTAARPGWNPPAEATLAAAVGAEAARQLLSHCLTTPYIEISATGIRERVRAGQSIRFLVPEPVASYIDAHLLYR